MYGAAFTVPLVRPWASRVCVCACVFVQVPLRVSDRIGNLYSPQTAVLYLDLKASVLCWLADVPASYTRTKASAVVSEADVEEAPLPRSDWRLNSTHWGSLSVSKGKQDALSPRPAEATSVLSTSSPDPRRSLDFRKHRMLKDKEGPMHTPLSARAPPDMEGTAVSLVSTLSSEAATPVLPPPRFALNSLSFSASMHSRTLSSADEASEARYWLYVTSGHSLCDPVTVLGDALPESAAEDDGTVPPMRPEWMGRVSQKLPPAPSHPEAVMRANAILDAEMKRVRARQNHTCTH